MTLDTGVTIPLDQDIDITLAKKPTDFDQFIRAMEASGYEVKQGKHLAFRAPDQQRFTRCKALGDGYDEQAIRDHLVGKEPAKFPLQKVNLLIDIQARIQAGKGPGYEHWAKVFNLKQAAQTLIFLQENGLKNYEDLHAETARATEEFQKLDFCIKALEKQLSENAFLQKHIIQYSKTRDIYIAYRKAGYSKTFYAEHETEILQHREAKKAFDALEIKKLPNISSLRRAYDHLLREKRKAYGAYKSARSQMRELLTIKSNVEQIVTFPLNSKTKGKGHERF